MRKWIILLALLLVPGAAHAEWFEASSAHFVVYADESEHDVREFSAQLERFHAAMELVTGLKQDPPSPSSRVTVFMVKNQRQIERLVGARNIGGFYIPRAGGSVAFVPRVEATNGQPEWPMIALLHEYAHHFLLSGSRFPSPRWFAEGGAEFFASVRFEADGEVNIGLPAVHRGWELALARNVKAAELLDSAASERRAASGSQDAFYGKSWALYHYLIFTRERTGQLRAYVRAMAEGKTSLQAAEETFGDLDELERELQRYLDQRRLLGFTIQPEALPIAPIALRRISAGEADMMPVRIRSDRGVTREQAVELLVDARRVAARYPADPAVLAALAEAEFDAGNDAEAIDAADRALALDPNQVNAYVQKGLALFHRAAQAAEEDKTEAYRLAIQPFLALNKLENDHPLPLVFYFRSFAERGVTPSEQAVRGLERATELAPFDLDLQFMLATYRIQAGDFTGARDCLVPIAYHPHGGGLADAARRVIERIDAEGEPAADELIELLRPPKDAKPPEGETPAAG
jgi:tetratricopeptide (TPR) repeat protein